MAKGREIQYINSAVCGSSAYQLAVEPVKKKKRVRLPKPRSEQKILIAFDPVAVFGIVVSILLLALLVTGVFRLQEARTQTLTMEKYVSSLQDAHQNLQDTYRAGYDLEEIEKIALAMGKVPSSQVTHIKVPVTVPQQEPEITGWEELWTFLVGLFA